MIKLASENTLSMRS